MNANDVIRALSEAVDGEYETLPMHRYEIEEKRQSKVDPDLILTVTVGMRCPRCKHKQTTMDHRDKRTCPKCGLKMELHGNALRCKV